MCLWAFWFIINFRMISTVLLISAMVTNQNRFSEVASTHFECKPSKKLCLRRTTLILCFSSCIYMFLDLFLDEGKNQYKISHIYYSVKLSVWWADAHLPLDIFQSMLRFTWMSRDNSQFKPWNEWSYCRGSKVHGLYQHQLKSFQDSTCKFII